MCRFRLKVDAISDQILYRLGRILNVRWALTDGPANERRPGRAAQAIQ